MTNKAIIFFRNETIGEINHKYKKCLIYDKARNNRKEDLMFILSRVESKASLMTAKTERLRNILVSMSRNNKNYT